MSGMPLFSKRNISISRTNEINEIINKTKDVAYPVKKIPTGVADFDSIVKGGLPAGSVMILLGDVGAGQHEYVYTSAAKLAIVKENPHLRGFYIGQVCDGAALPERICYVTFCRSRSDILQEVSASFNFEYYEALRDNILFKDFSSDYFRHSIVPQSWTDHEKDKLFAQPAEKRSLLEALIDFFDANAQNSVIIIDSLTDLIISKLIDINELVTTIKGLQRASKRWQGLIYLLLTKDVVDAKEQQMLIDSVDGVIVFEWSKYLRSSKRQRYMYVEKFMSVLPHLDRDRIARFPIMVSAHSGLVVVNIERIA